MKRASLNALQQVKAAATGEVSPPLRAVAKEESASAIKRSPSRVGKTNITGYFPVEVKNALRMVQIRTGKNFQNLLEEALTDLFRKHNVPVPTDKHDEL